jgi:hypothetical protein
MGCKKVLGGGILAYMGDIIYQSRRGVVADIEYFERLKREEKPVARRPSVVGVFRLFEAMLRCVAEGDKRGAEEYFELMWARVWNKGFDGN